MDHLLFLAHRIPYPPNKGDKIRSWHVLRHLSQRFHVHLGCLYDDPADRQHIDCLRQLCASVGAVPLNGRLARVASLRGLLSGEALTFPYFRSRHLTSWVAECRRRYPIALQFAFSSSMAPYALQGCPPNAATVIDLVDIDSDKWAQYADLKRWPMNWIYRREARLLEDAERRIALAADATLLVSEAEASLFRQRARLPATRVHSFGNGVDLKYFAPDQKGARPYPAGSRVAVFTGAMDYWPNIDAVTWFVDKVLPRLQADIPDLLFCIAGARPTPAVAALGTRKGVLLTGSVSDLRPFLAHADVVVAPLRVARGIQNKVLEAMAMGKAVIATPQAFEGLEAAVDRDLVVAADSVTFAASAIRLLRDAGERSRLGDSARRRVEAAYSWPSRLAELDRVLGQCAAGRAVVEQEGRGTCAA